MNHTHAQAVQSTQLHVRMHEFTYSHIHTQGWYQIYALLITLVISIVGGIIAGNVARNLCSRNVTVALPAEVAAQITSARKQNQHFDDSEHWVLEEEEENGHGDE